jgi:hypothetical protein
MVQWITDRLPTINDGDYEGKVWITDDELVFGTPWYNIKVGTPWQKRIINRPAPYVKPEPERFRPEVNQVYFSIVSHYVFNQAWLGTSGDHDRYAIGNCFETREQAEAALGKVKELLLSMHLETTRSTI